MAFSHGSKAVLIVNSVPITAYTESAELNFDVDTDDIRVMGARVAEYVAGLVAGALNSGAVYDPAIAAVIYPAALAREPVTFEFGPQGSDAGMDKWTGDLIISGFRISTSTRAKATCNWTAVTTGEINLGSYSA